MVGSTAHWTRLGEVNHALWPGRDWLPVEALPLDSIAPAAALPATTAPVVRLIVDSLGRTTLMREDQDRSLHANGGWMPRLDLSSVSGARAAMAELAAATGPTATAVGSFGDSLWVDLWHALARRQLRAWRSPDSPVRTTDIWGGEEAQPPPMFDPATLDPAQALQGWSTIVERAGLRRGRVTSWAYRIPRLQHQERGPLLVYSIGSTPAVQVWVGPDDEVISVEATDY
ncbi:hypothetical protein [Parenemella sanctibonifatiensis]|uniref:Uncharacterized protein n=1 Tax=Parenemella sanctibonifatiensis TaxID=2016505 RepID=A0A255EHE6_9ACTN|nr:hypothetical protein [Parenemella sanctibonifatiensis]OYN89035.1 hypothetical protein CGZ91_12265 [Parenemella sanctibonifatiensis]